jgi:hypothetical protein
MPGPWVSVLVCSFSCDLSLLWLLLLGDVLPYLLSWMTGRAGVGDVFDEVVGQDDLLLVFAAVSR